MDNSFEIPVIYKGEEVLFPAALETRGYTYSIVVKVFGALVSFEPDEEGNYRAMADAETMRQGMEIDKALLESIATTLQQLFSE
jgi:hypothetical protein